MAEIANQNEQNRVLSKTLRAERRTYFFDMKSTKSEQMFLTITESKRRFDNDSGNFFYEKHKIFLYEEDFENFKNILSDIIAESKKPDTDSPSADPAESEDQ